MAVQEWRLHLLQASCRRGMHSWAKLSAWREPRDECSRVRARTRVIRRCHTFRINNSSRLRAARLRERSSCRSVPTFGDLCEHHAEMATEVGRDTVVDGSHAKRRNARGRVPVPAESEPLELRSSPLPSAVRPALALTAAEEVETIRRVLLEAATSTSRESWATCTCPGGKSFRQEISVPDHGARIKPVETLLREGLGRVGEADVPTPRMPSSVAEVEAKSWEEMKVVFALSHAQAIKHSSSAATKRSTRRSAGGNRKLAQASLGHSPTSPE